jgi:hypothetical integral membrane protein (TIGR02206 family)
MNMLTSLHIKTVFLIAILIVANLYAGLKFKSVSIQGFTYRNFFGLLTVFFGVIYNLYYLILEKFEWSVSLPLHICDILVFVAGISLAFPSKTPRALLYFWGLSLSTQAFLYPVGDQNPLHIHYWLFWGIHTFILACCVYDLFVNKYRPLLNDLIISVKYGFLYILVVLPINIIFGWNYGYLGNQNPEIPTVIDFLGSWPYRILVMVIIAIAVQTLLLFPWRFKSFFLRKILR